MDSDLSDIRKIETALYGNSSRDEFTINETSCQSDSGDGFSITSSYQQPSPLQPQNTFSIFEEYTSTSTEDEDHLVIDEMEPSLENALVLNKAYQTILMELLQQLEVLKVVNHGRQKAVGDEIRELETIIQSTKKSVVEKKKRRIPFTFFGMPYFKDSSFRCAPKNDDALLTENIGFHNIAVTGPLKPFSKYEARRLKAGLKEQAYTIQATILMKKRRELQNQLSAISSTSLSEDDRKSLEKDLDVIQRQLYEVNVLPDEKLLDIDPDAVDWQKIAIVNLQRSRTPDQLKLYFSHYMHPKVNFQPWTVEENRRLRELAEKYNNGFDWDKIAKDLNTNRTPYECFHHYQERFNRKHRKFGWNLEDNKKLIKLISQYRDKTTQDIDWYEVRHHFPGRSRDQLYAHFRYYTETSSTDPFTVAEDTLILEGVKIGYDLSDIALLLGKRTTVQIRYRYKSIQNKTYGLDKPWTEKENNLLLKLKSVTQLTRYAINRDYPGRSFPQLFARFHFLRMKLTTPEKYVERLKKEAIERKKQCPKYLTGVGGKIMDIVGRESPDLFSNKIPLKKSIIPRLKKELVYAEQTGEIFQNRSYRSSKQKFIRAKIKELKEILRPYMITGTKRMRRLSFPGDGREYGIVLASLYRLLQCNFTSAPPENLSMDEMEELGIEENNYLPYLTCTSLVKNMENHALDNSTNNIVCLPPTLSTLTGFRGLLLHRKYLITSAKQDYTLPRSTQTKIVELNVTQESAPETDTLEEDSTSESDEENEKSEGQNEQKAANGKRILVSKNQSSVESATLTKKQSFLVQLNNKEVTSSQEKEALPTINSQNTDEDNSIAMSGVNGNATDIRSSEKKNQSQHCTTEEENTDAEDNLHEEVENFVQQHPATTDDEEDEEEEEDDEPAFGNQKADALLLSRLLALFYWPGIMSTLHVPEKLKEDAKKREEDEQDSGSTSGRETPLKKTKWDHKLEAKKKRQENIRALLQRRYGLPDKPPENHQEICVPSTSSEAENRSTVDPPPKKKPKKNWHTDAPPSDRVTRSRRSTN